jgi:hypothetical protein
MSRLTLRQVTSKAQMSVGKAPRTPGAGLCRSASGLTAGVRCRCTQLVSGGELSSVE